jgi:hypothetical protein
MGFYNPRLKGSILDVGAVRSEIPPRLNGSGGSLNKGQPTRLDSSGQLLSVDPTVESQAKACLGLVKQSVGPSGSTAIVLQGRLVDVTVPGSVGDLLYISKTGGITNTQPSIGVGGFLAGDFVVSVGVIAANLSNNLLTDIMVDIKIVGQL